MISPILQLEGVYKSFGSNCVLKNFALNVPANKSLVVLGGSGTGKSVMLKIALGLLKPDRGHVFFDGEEVTHVKDKKRDFMLKRIGMLFQSAALFDSLSVWENVAFRLLHTDKVKRTEAKELAIATLRKVHLNASTADLYPSEMSGGMQKRVGLARAIITNPDLIFFDEPTTGLDPITADAINDLIIEQVRALGAAAVSITHDIASARKIADEVAMLHDGKIIWRGIASSLDSSGNEHLDQFVNGRAKGPIKPAID